jgi:dihydrofolate synthase/folylpolyglutamate synthase
MDNLDDAYKNALEYLYSFVDFSMQKVDTYSPARFKLERMEEVIISLGNPEAKYPCIHVAGTKGKGSVCILCASALQQAGYKVGLYTSPHLDDYAERIQINGEFISHADLVRMVEILKPHVAAIPELTTFEITTALAFLYFAEQEVDAAVIEVGLGGRLDATNIVRPIVSVITSISYDHTLLLGNTLTQIAAEKAGIIKTGVTVVSSPQDDEVSQVIEQVAHQSGSPVVKVSRDIFFKVISSTLKDQTIAVWSLEQSQDNPLILSIPLLGAHQASNAATAYAALQIFDKYGLRINEEAIKLGFAKAFWPGRFEIIQNSPPVILDCAHNRDSALKLRLTLAEYYPGRQVILVFGASEDKDIQGMFAELLPSVKEMIAVKSYHPRAIGTDKLVGMAQAYGNLVICFEDIPDAVEKALELADNNSLVLVTGSIFVVAEARKYLEKNVNIRRY